MPAYCGLSSETPFGGVVTRRIAPVQATCQSDQCGERKPSSDAAVGQVYNICHDQPLTQKELLWAIAEELGVAPPRLHVPYLLLYAAAFTAERVAVLTEGRFPPFVTRHAVKLYGADNRLSIERARRELGFAPQVSVREGVRRTASWFQHPESWGPDDAVENVRHGARSG